MPISKISLKEFQTKYMERFNIFTDFLESHEIRYSLAYGSLLGALREKNIIKWDCDIDIFMFDEEVTNLLSIVNCFPDIFYAKTFKNNEEIYGLTRIYVKDLFRREQGLTIPRNAYFDIFHVVNIKRDRKALNLVGSRIKRETNIYLFKTSWYSPKSVIKRLIKPVVQFLLPSAKLMIRKCDRYFRKLNIGYDNMITYYYAGILKPLPYSSGYSKLLFGSKECFVFENYIELILATYGSDFMVPKDYGLVTGVEFFEDK